MTQLSLITEILRIAGLLGLVMAAPNRTNGLYLTNSSRFSSAVAISQVEYMQSVKGPPESKIKNVNEETDHEEYASGTSSKMCSLYYRSNNMVSNALAAFKGECVPLSRELRTQPRRRVLGPFLAGVEVADEEPVEGAAGMGTFCLPLAFLEGAFQ